MKVERRTVDLASYPDLVVIYLGMRVNAMTGLKTLFGFGPTISNSVTAAPEGLLRHETVIYSLLASACGNAAVLARLRIAGAMGTLGATHAMVEEFPARLWWDRILA